MPSTSPTLAYTRGHGHCLWEINLVDGIEARRFSDVLRGYLLISPDGQHVACIRGDSPYIVDGFQGRPVSVGDLAGDNLHWSMSWAPDGASLAFCCSDAIYVVTSIRAEEAPELAYVISANSPSVAWSPDGSLIAYSSWEEGLYVSNLDGECDQIGRGQRIEDMSWSPVGDLLAFSTPEGVGGIWCVDVATGRQQPLTDDPRDEDPVWSPCGKAVAYTRWSPGEIRTVRNDGTEDTLLRADQAADVAWSPDGARIAYTLHSRFHHEPRATIIDSASGERRWHMGVGGQPVWLDDKQLAWLRWMGESISTVDLTSGDRIDLYTHRGTPAVWSPNGKKVAYLDLADPSKSKLITSYTHRHNPRVLAVGETSEPIWLGNGNVVAWTSPDGAHTSNPGGTQHHHFPATEATRMGCCYIEVEFSPDGRRVAYPTDDSLIIAESADHIEILPAPASSHAPVVWSPDSRRVAYPTDDSLIIAESADHIEILPAPASSHATVVWSPDSRRVAYPTDDSLIIAESADHIEILPVPASSYATVVWSPDGSHIAHASSGGVLTVRRNGQDKRMHYDKDAGSGYLVWSPTGARLMWYPAYDDHRPLVIAEIGSNHTHVLMVGYVADAVWSKDGTHIAFVSDDDLVAIRARSGQQQLLLSGPAISSPQWL